MLEKNSPYSTNGTRTMRNAIQNGAIRTVEVSYYEDFLLTATVRGLPAGTNLLTWSLNQMWPALSSIFTAIVSQSFIAM